MADLARFESRSGLPIEGRGRWVSLALALLLLISFPIWWWLTPQDVSAHANLVSSEPAANSELEEPPDRIIIRFTEPIEPSLSHIQVLDASGQRVDLDNSEVDDLNPLVMTVGVSEIPDGAYTVAWRNVSTVDGHKVRGSFVFAVGQPLTYETVPAVEQPLLQSPWAPALRWLTLLAALAMVGGLVFEILVTRPVLLASRTPDAVRAIGTAVSARSRRLVAAAAGLFLAASVGHLLLVATITHEVSLWGAFGGPIRDTITVTDWGGLWVWRMAAVLGFAVVLAGIRFFTDPWQQAVRLLLLGLGCAVLWSLTLTSHGAATVDIRNLAIAADFLHLVASAFWVGALFHFAMGVGLFRNLPESERMERLAEGVPRFSVMAALSVAVIVVTGVFSGWAQVTVNRGPGHPLRRDTGREGCPGDSTPVPGGAQPGLGPASPPARSCCSGLAATLPPGGGRAGRSHPGRRRNVDQPGTGPAGGLPGSSRAAAVVDIQRHREHRHHRTGSHPGADWFQ